MTNLGGEGHVVMLSEPGFFFFMFRLIEKKIEKSVVSLKNYESLQPPWGGLETIKMTNLGGEGHVVMLSEPEFFIFFMFRLIEEKIFFSKKVWYP